MRRMGSQRWRVAAGLALAAGVAGCWLPFVAGGVAGAAAYAYVQGEGSKVYYGAPLTRIQKAVRTVLTKDLDMAVIHDAADSVDARFEARDRHGRDLVAKLHLDGPQVVKVSIRVDVMGDEEFTHLAFEKIDARLGVKKE